MMPVRLSEEGDIAIPERVKFNSTCDIESMLVCQVTPSNQLLIALYDELEKGGYFPCCLIDELEHDEMFVELS